MTKAEVGPGLFRGGCGWERAFLVHVGLCRSPEVPPHTCTRCVPGGENCCPGCPRGPACWTAEHLQGHESTCMLSPYKVTLSGSVSMPAWTALAEGSVPSPETSGPAQPRWARGALGHWNRLPTAGMQTLPATGTAIGSGADPPSPRELQQGRNEQGTPGTPASFSRPRCHGSGLLGKNSRRPGRRMRADGLHLSLLLSPALPPPRNQVLAPVLEASHEAQLRLRGPLSRFLGGDGAPQGKPGTAGGVGVQRTRLPRP